MEGLVSSTIDSIILFWAGLAQVLIYFIPIFGQLLFIFEVVAVAIIWWLTTTIPT